MEVTGLIIKATGGFYYVQTSQGSFACRARGLFRKSGVTPYVGDHATLEPTEPGNGYIIALSPRKNSLLRPPVANLDRLGIVASCCQPAANPLVLDKLLVLAERQGIEPLLIITKSDLGSTAELEEIYRPAGFAVHCVSSHTGRGIAELARLLGQGITVLTGNSGAGKSSLLNALQPGLALETADISKKLGRGRHTTRHVELFPFGEGFIADTPGFSSLELERFEQLPAEELAACFPEFAPHLAHCRFPGCAHIKEKDCAVLAALEAGEIHPSRHRSYTLLYQQLKEAEKF